MKIVWPDQREEVIVLTVSKQFPSSQLQLRRNGKFETASTSSKRRKLTRKDEKKIVVLTRRLNFMNFVKRQNLFGKYDIFETIFLTVGS